MNATEFEMCVQWYRPELQSVPSASSNENGQQNQQTTTLFLYAFNNKAVNLASVPGSAAVKAGRCNVSLARFQALHEELMTTREMAESDLKPTSSQSSVGAGTHTLSLFSCCYCCCRSFYVVFVFVVTLGV